jgi:hypothetical protein
MKKFCEECGASLSLGVQFCENCGARLSEADEPAPADGPTPLARASGSVSATDRLQARQSASSEGSRFAMEKPGKTGAELEPFAYAGGNLYPSYIIAASKVDEGLRVNTAPESALGDRTGWVGVHLPCNAYRTQVKVGVEENSFIYPSAPQEFEMEGAGQRFLILPEISWKYEELLKVDQPRPLDVRFTVEYDKFHSFKGEQIQTVKNTLNLRSINDCVFAFRKPEGGWGSCNELFSAYVNESHPWIDKLLQKGLEAGRVRRWTGYLEHDDEVVLAQVRAVWETLQERSTKYSSITTASGADRDVFSQHVRFLDQSVEHTQANCADGTVLFASILRKIGIDPYLVLVPGHMFLGFGVVEGTGEPTHCLETTLIGEEGQSDFENAVETGDYQYAMYEEELEAQTDPNFQVVSIGEAREKGFMPIAFVKN